LREGKYRISQIAQLLGVTSEAIRFYEKKGLLHQSREDESGYRYYTTWDLHMLLRIRVYKQLGVPLADIARLLREESNDLSLFNQTIEEQRRALKEQLLMDQKRLERLDDLSRFIAMVEHFDPQRPFQECTQEGIYLLMNQKLDMLQMVPEVQQEFKKWTVNPLFVFSSGVCAYEDLQANKELMAFGIGINEKYADLLGICENDIVRYYPPRRCLHTLFASSSEDPLDYQKIRKLVDQVEAMRFELNGDVTTHTILTTQPGNTYHNWHGIYIPIK